MAGSGDEAAPVAPPAVTVSDEAAEGVLLFEYASRMTLKNHIIVAALRGGMNFDADSVAAEARDTLAALAGEAQTSARRMAEEREIAETLGGRGRHQHDYRAGDTGNLARRKLVYGAMATMLRDRMDDPVALAGLVESARLDAWDEVSGAIDAALDRRAEAGAVVPADEAERQQAIAEFVAVDLPALAARDAAAPTRRPLRARLLGGLAARLHRPGA